MKPRLFLVTTLWLAANLGAADLPRVIDAKMYRLGDAGAPEWFDRGKPDAVRLTVTFHAAANAGPATVFLRQKGVKFARPVELNGKKIGGLLPVNQALVHTVTLPAGALREGENTLTIPPSPGGDDIEVGDFRISSGSPEGVLHRAMLEVVVTDADAGAGLPCRITITDQHGSLAALSPAPGQTLAARPGVIYTRDGKAKVGLLPGSYTIYATRGFEYGVEAKPVTMRDAQPQQVELAIRREVPTPGLVASDTHLHTLTFSKHGDATMEERMLTIAGEGIELPIATDHNIHADYSEPSLSAGVQSFFTPVRGNEVTTKVGHFNAFPIQPGSPVVDHRVEGWPKLMAAVRATPGVKVVTLNHPRDEHSKFVPLGPANFNAATGEVLFAPELGFDAMEVITSGAMQSDVMLLFRDWFALLNAGRRLTAIASSDTHDVARFILGQARSYVMCDDRDPAKIGVDAACESFLAGRVLVSMGLLAQMTVEEKFAVGDLATNLGETVRVTVKVLGPSWTRADRVELFANGVKIREEAIAPSAAVEKARVNWHLPRPRHDMHLVAIATGPGIDAPYCETPRPYQPSSKVFTPRVIGATNAVWLDGDGDAHFTAARSYAEQLIAKHSTEAAKLLPALAEYDEAIARQAAALCHARGQDIHGAVFADALQRAGEHVRRGVSAVVESLRQRQ